jgi:hypothetical protein
MMVSSRGRNRGVRRITVVIDPANRAAGKGNEPAVGPWSVGKDGTPLAHCVYTSGYGRRKQSGVCWHLSVCTCLNLIIPRFVDTLRDAQSYATVPNQGEEKRSKSVGLQTDAKTVGKALGGSCRV